VNSTNLSFSALPPIDVPFRYFLTGPIFLIFIALFVLFVGDDMWLSRWHPNMLMVTHAFTLGFITVIMMGALLQILPVMGAGSLPNVRKIGAWCHVCHVLGTVFLMVSFIYPNEYVKLAAMCFLFISFSVYIGSLYGLLRKKLSKSCSIMAIKLALFGLLITVGIGLLMVANTMSFWTIALDKMWTDIHAEWGLLVWMSILIMAVSFQVVPLFHVAPNFSKKITKYLPFSLLSAVMIISWKQNLFQPFGIFILLGLCGYMLNLLLLLNKRKRKIPDTSIYFWQLSALTLFVTTLLTIIPDSFISEDLRNKKILLIAAILIFFYVVSIIQGLLLKILPFLCYTHLQQRCLTNFSAMSLIPNMHDLLKKKHGKWLFNMHICTGCALIATIIYPSLYWLFGSLLLAEFSGLLYLMLRIISQYKKCLTEILLLD